MTDPLKGYLETVRGELKKALCLTFVPSPLVERQTHPEIEIPSSPYSLQEPIRISRGPNEEIFIERSINSARISIKLKKIDELDGLLTDMFCRFLMQRAENLDIIRKKPIAGYDLSFLITECHTSITEPSKFVDFIISLLEGIYKELSEMKLLVNGTSRMVADELLQSLC